MKIHSILRLVLCITGISTGIIQANEIPHPQPSLSFGLGSWIRAIFTPNKLSTKQHFTILGGIGLCGAGYFGVRSYNNWCKEKSQREIDEAKRIQDLEDATHFHIKKENWNKVVKHNQQEELRSMMTLASKIYNDKRNTCQFNAVFQSDAERTINGIYGHCTKNMRTEYTITGSKKGISKVTAAHHLYKRKIPIIENADLLKPCFDAQYDLELRNPQHARQLAVASALHKINLIPDLDAHAEQQAEKFEARNKERELVQRQKNGFKNRVIDDSNEVTDKVVSNLYGFGNRVAGDFSY